MLQYKYFIKDKKSYSPKINDLVISCKFKQKDCDLDKEFEYYFDTQYGNCYRYNANQQDEKFVTQSGETNGLELEFLIGSSFKNNGYFSRENGFNIFIKNKSDDSSFSEGVRISPGFSTDIIINKYSITKQPQPYSNCIANLDSVDSYGSECYKKTFTQLQNLNKTYSYVDCYKICYQKQVAIKCDCQTNYYDLVYDTKMRICLFENSTERDGPCMTNIWDDIAFKSSILSECDCPLECERNGYKYRSSSAQYPTLSYSKYLRSKSNLLNNTDYDELRKSVARVNIYYENMKQTIITEEIKTKPSDLISNAGGLLGLFLGLSFLSFAEFIEIILKIIIILFKNSS